MPPGFCAKLYFMFASNNFYSMIGIACLRRKLISRKLQVQQHLGNVIKAPRYDSCQQILIKSCFVFALNNFSFAIRIACLRKKLISKKLQVHQHLGNTKHQDMTEEFIYVTQKSYICLK